MARGYSSQSSQLEAMNMTHYVVTRWYRAPEVMLSPNSYDKASKSCLTWVFIWETETYYI